MPAPVAGLVPVGGEHVGPADAQHDDDKQIEAEVLSLEPRDWAPRYTLVPDAVDDLRSSLP